MSVVSFFTTTFLTRPLKDNVFSFWFSSCGVLVVFVMFMVLQFLVVSLFCSQTLFGSVPSLFQRMFRYLCFVVTWCLFWGCLLLLFPCDPSFSFQSNPLVVSRVSVYVVCVFILLLLGAFSVVFSFSCTMRLAPKKRKIVWGLEACSPIKIVLAVAPDRFLGSPGKFEGQLAACPGQKD